MFHWMCSILLASAIFATRASGQTDVLVQPGFDSLGFADAFTGAQRGTLLYTGGYSLLGLTPAGDSALWGLTGIAGDGNAESLSRLDTRTEIFTNVGSTGFDWDKVGLALHRPSGVLYALARVPGGPTSLYSIDTATGSPTSAVQLSIPFADCSTFAIDASGTAYVTSLAPGPPWHFRVRVVDLATGALTLVGDCAEALTATPALGYAAFRSDGICLLATQSTPYTSYAIDVATLHSTQLPFQFSIAIAPASEIGLAYDESCSATCPCTFGGVQGDGCPTGVSIYGSVLRAFGTASLSNDTLDFLALGVTNVSGTLFQGSSLIAPVVFGAGLRCVGGSVIRLRTGSVVNHSFEYPLPGQMPVSIKGQIALPGLRHYQLLFRDSAGGFCGSGPITNLTNSVSVAWAP